MSIEHSLICDQCGAVIAAASTLVLARADAAALGAVRIGRRDICQHCSTGCAGATMTRRSTSVQEPIDSTASANACARCPLPDCGSDLHISTHVSRPVFLADTSDDLARSAPYTSTWEIGCSEGHVLLLPSGADDHDTFGQARDDDGSDHDLARLRRLIAVLAAVAVTSAVFDRWASDDLAPPSEPVLGSLGSSLDAAMAASDLDQVRRDCTAQSASSPLPPSPHATGPAPVRTPTKGRLMTPTFDFRLNLERGRAVTSDDPAFEVSLGRRSKVVYVDETATIEVGADFPPGQVVIVASSVRRKLVAGPNGMAADGYLSLVLARIAAAVEWESNRVLVVR